LEDNEKNVVKSSEVDVGGSFHELPYLQHVLLSYASLQLGNRYALASLFALQRTSRTAQPLANTVSYHPDSFAFRPVVSDNGCLLQDRTHLPDLHTGLPV
jgi:hypothetical protein